MSEGLKYKNNQLEMFEIWQNAHIKELASCTEGCTLKVSQSKSFEMIIIYKMRFSQKGFRRFVCYITFKSHHPIKPAKELIAIL